VPKLIAMWNGVRGVWEKPGTVNLLCEHSELFSESWPTSGTMRNGRAFELPMPALPISVSESLLLRTPAASEAERGHQPEEKAKARGGQVTLSGQFMSLLPTTRAQHGEDRNNTVYARSADKPQNLENALANLPTPTVADTFTDNLKSSQQKEGSMHSVNLSQAVHMTWGRFQPAINRWEVINGFPAPAPTEPTGKDGAPRLSSKFTEWMMGLEPGWITGLGLSRKDELKACGNGVVPQQAKLALTILLDRVGSRIEMRPEP